MPSDSNLDKIPVSPIDDDDLWLINREDKSYKVTSKMLGGYLITSPVPEICDGDSDCPPDRECVDGYCERIPCDSEQPPGQEGCPPDFVCIGDYCYPKCDATQPAPCGEGYVCVDPGVSGGDSICLPYPFPCRPDILPGDGCPPGYTCWGDSCWQTCSGAGSCPPGMDCVETPTNEGVGYICVPSGGGFPCADGVCPVGYECFFGMCFKECDITGGGVPCEEGFVCVGTDNGDYCVPYPFPCDLYGPGCPEGMVCYNGDCYPECDASDADSCEEGFGCLNIGGGITICFPDFPQEGFVNDGPLVVRTEPLGYPDVPASERIVFTANQYGRSVLTFQGFAQNPGGPGGGDCSQGQECPPGYSCVGGICILTPCGSDGDCPDGTTCFAGHCYKPCDITENRPCDPGFECVEVVPGLTLCLPGGETGGGKCDDGVCPPGYQCTTINGEKYCTPTPCNNGNCANGLQCYQGFCYKPCGGIGDDLCKENFECVEIPSLPDSICMPIGGGPDGGGSGGDLNIIIDPGWWNPDENEQSPIGNGILILKDKDGDIVPLFSANQFENSIFTMSHLDIIPPGSGGACNNNNQCPAGEFCFNGKCITGSGGTCSKNSDCPADEVCIDGKCFGNGTGGGVGGDINVEINDYHDSKWEHVTGKTGDIRPKESATQVLPKGNSKLGSTAARWKELHTDTVDIASHIYPKTNNEVKLGSTSLRFKELHTNTVDIDTHVTPKTNNAVNIGSTSLRFKELHTNTVDVADHVTPKTNNSVNIGSSSLRFKNVYATNLYTYDLHMSNMEQDEGNIIDGSKGDWTIQEGKDDLYLINNITGKRYKFKIEEVD